MFARELKSEAKGLYILCTGKR